MDEPTKGFDPVNRCLLMDTSKGHRGFISGGTQIDIKLKDGREFTVSVSSVPDFCTAVEGAKNQL